MRGPLLLTLCALACGKPPPQSEAIRFLANPDVGGGFKEIIRSFERKNPGVRIEMVEGPPASNSREDLYAASLMFKDPTYDLVYMDVAWTAKFAARGWLLPLDGWFPPREQAKFLPGDIAGSRYEGKIYRLPIRSDAGLLYYRKDLLDSRGLSPPRTWEELVAEARQLQDPPRLWGFVFQGRQYEGLTCDFLEFVWGRGGELLDGRGRVTIDGPEAVSGLERMVGAVRKEGISPKAVLTYQEEEARHAFQSGGAVFMRNWSYAWNLLQAQGSPVRGKVGLAPMVGAGALGGWGFGVSAFSRRPRLAWEAARFFASEESLRTGFLKNGNVPARKALFRDPALLAAAPQLRDLYRILRQARPRPMLAGYARVSDALQWHVSAALSAQEEPRAALAAAADDIRAILRMRP